jgi:putative ABC transport system permease protein
LPHSIASQASVTHEFSGVDVDWKAHLRTALAADGEPPDEDVLEELSQHAAAAYDAACAEGCTHDDAIARVEHLIAEWRRAAPLLRRKPIVPLPASQPYASQWLAATLHDIRYAFRTLRREPGYTTLVITLMALGIAATTTLVSVASGVLLEPLPWPEPERLVRLEERREGRSGRIPWTISNGTYLAWRESPSSTIEELGGWMWVQSTFRGAGDPERIWIARITPSAFSVVRARPAMGRLFNEDDAGSPATTTTAILSHAFWQQRFNGAADAIGRGIQLDERSYTIVGVMPPDFAFPDRDTQVWIPQRIQPVSSDGGKRLSVSIFSALARMRPGVTPEQVAAEATARARAGADLGPAGLALFGSRAASTIVAVPALDVLTAEVRPALGILLVAVVLLLTTAVGSIAILQLARAAKRRREMTLRVALGARTIHLTRQWLSESALVGIAGGLAGVAGAAVILRLLPAILPPDFPRMADVSLDWRAAASAAAATLLASLISALVPTLQSRRVDLAHSLAEDSIATVGGAKRSSATRIRAAIMVGQIAVACLLMVGAGLLARSLTALINVDRGYDPHNLLTAQLPLPPRTTFAQAAPTLETLQERLRAVPGVSEAAFGNALPLVSAGGMSGLTVPSPRDPSVNLEIQALHRTVSPGYFDVMGLRLIAGRRLNVGDSEGSTSALVVNRSFAAQYLGEHPVGQRLNFRGPGAGTVSQRGVWEVVGVIEDMKQGGLDRAGIIVSTADTNQPEMFTSYRQLGVAFAPSVFLVMRTTGDPSSLTPTLRALIREHAPSLVLDSVMTMEDRLMATLAKPRTYAFVLAAFALFALAISGAGLFGVLSYGVAQRTREIGVRSALGARASDLVGLVLRQAVLMTITGLVIGVSAAALLTTSLSRVLYGISPYDTASFVVGPILVALVALAACVAPARRAIAIDPLRALRSE